MKKIKRYKGYEMEIDNGFVMSAKKIKSPQQKLLPYKKNEYGGIWINVDGIVSEERLKEGLGTIYQFK